MKKPVSPGVADRKHKRRTTILVLVLVFLALLLFFLRAWLPSSEFEPIKPATRGGSGLDSTGSYVPDSGSITDSLKDMVTDTGDTVSDTTESAILGDPINDAQKSDMKEHNTEQRKKNVNSVSRSLEHEVDSSSDSGEITTGSPHDSSDSGFAEVIYDTSDVDAPHSDPCEFDTIPPWVFADPSGGLHASAPSVELRSDDYAVIEWRFGDEVEWKSYRGSPIPVTENAQLVFRAFDDCGNMSEIRSEEYDLGGGPDEAHCPGGMTYIEISDVRFCIDTYEWPNKKGARPRAFVSIYQAMDSCFTVGKRLCTTEEWSLACAGPYSRPYPYGDVYEPRACNTQDTTLARSGSCPECRGYFGVQDMSGNLAEWTDTRSSRNRQFYNVMGGFWATGSNATCRNERYSYYPQNRHNPVGFRCCADAE